MFWQDIATWGIIGFAAWLLLRPLWQQSASGCDKACGGCTVAAGGQGEERVQVVSLGIPNQSAPRPNA